MTAADSLAGQTPSTSTTHRSANSARRRNALSALLSGICLALAIIATPFAALSAWSATQLVPEDTFIATFLPLADNPEVQSELVTQTVTAIESRLDVDPLLISVLGLDQIIETGVGNIVRSQHFTAAWQATLAEFHRALAASSSAAPSAVSSTTPSAAKQHALTIDINPIIEAVKASLIADDITAASFIPSISATVTILSGNATTLTTVTYQLGSQLGWWMAVAVLALFAAGILFANRRATALLTSGLGILAASTTALIVLAVGGSRLAAHATANGISPSLLAAFYAPFHDGLGKFFWALLALGVVTAIAGLLLRRQPRAATKI